MSSNFVNISETPLKYSLDNFVSNQPNNGGIVKRKLLLGAGVAGSSLILAASPALADDAADPAVYLQAVMDNLWVFIAGILVFFMQAGFALVEAGLTRSKNVANIMAKNIADMCIGVLCFYAVGYAFAYGSGGGWFIGGNSYFLPDLPYLKYPKVCPQRQISSSKSYSLQQQSRSLQELWPDEQNSLPI